MRETFPWTFSPSRLDGQIGCLLSGVVTFTISKSEFTGLVQKFPDKGLCDAGESIIPCGLELCEFNTSAVSDRILLGVCTARAVPVPEAADHSLFRLGLLSQWQ